uniref:Uncharacterized protein n=1 Tax=Clytia hemisphaerica TaxID=252671 RepID=A0A7M5XC29_9CNID
MAVNVTNILSNVSHLKSQLSEKAKNLSTLIEQQYEQLCKLVAQKEQADVELKEFNLKKSNLDTEIANKNKVVERRQTEVNNKQNDLNKAEKDYQDAKNDKEKAERAQRDTNIGVGIGAGVLTVFTFGLAAPIAAAAVVGTVIGMDEHVKSKESKRSYHQNEYNSVLAILTNAQKDLQASQQEAAALETSLKAKQQEIKTHQEKISNYLSKMQTLQEEKKLTQIEDVSFNSVYQSIKNLQVTIKDTCTDKYSEYESVEKAFKMFYERLAEYGNSLTDEQLDLLEDQQKTLELELQNYTPAITFDF